MRFVILLGIVLCSVHSSICQISSDTTKTPVSHPLVPDSLRAYEDIKRLESVFGSEGPLIEGRKDTIPAEIVDSLQMARQMAADDTLKRDSIPSPRPEKREIETTINYSSEDSILFDLQNQDIFLYGKSKTDYGQIKLEADRIRVNWQDKTIQANFTIDSAGSKVGKPVFQKGSDVYETESMIYNFQTKKAVINGVVTEQEGGYIHGQLVKKNEEDEMFIRNASYTTCNLADPHFHIHSSKLKAIPKKKIISGPFNLRFGEIPTFLWFPFGMFPQPKEKASGILVPSYGEERRRGFFLRDGGYYFALSDYADLRLTGDIYTQGGYGLRAVTNYKKRYSFNGTFNFSYNRLQDDPLPGEESLDGSDFWIRWNHSPQSKGTGSFSASANFGTKNYNQNVNLVNQDVSRNITSSVSSNVSYRKTFKGTPFNLSTNLRHNQNLQSGVTTVTFPELTTNMNRIYPFKKLFNSKSPIGKISISHRLTARNELTNTPNLRTSKFEQEDSIRDFSSNPLSFGTELNEILRAGKMGARHAIPITTSFNLLKYFTVSPSVNYQEIWYFQKLKYAYKPENQVVDIDTTDLFKKLERLSTYSMSASMNTTLYGQVYINSKKIQAIRHVVRPSLSFSYTPETPESKDHQYVQINENKDSVRVSFYEGFLFGTPSTRESKRVSLSVTNNLEMKVRSKKDTVNEFTKVKIFDNLSFNTGYDFGAESFNLSDITWNARTSLFNNKVSIAMNGAFDPYDYVLNEPITSDSRGNKVVNQTRINRFAWNSGKGIGQLKRISSNISFSLRPKSSKDKGENEPDTPGYDNFANDPTASTNYTSDFGTEEELAYINANPEEYVDFNIPWSLSVRYNISRNKVGFQDPRVNQTLSLNGDISITEKTKINFSSGYDIEKKQFTQTRLSVNRDLHCWTLNFNWVPFGRFQSFNLTIRVKAAVLQDLKLEKRRSFADFF